MKKKLTTVLAIVLVVALSVAGTYAYLTDTTGPVKNTFTVGNVNIGLTETTGEFYKMVPGTAINKDPKVTVKADSEDCWLFVKVDKSANFADFLTYDMAADWTALEGVDGVFYRQVEASDANQVFPVIANDTVRVKSGVTKAMMDGLTDATRPTMTFTAYAIQADGFTTADKAWTEVNK